MGGGVLCLGFSEIHIYSVIRLVSNFGATVGNTVFPPFSYFTSLLEESDLYLIEPSSSCKRYFSY